MSNTETPTIGGLYTGYNAILETYNRKRKETPRGVSLKLQKQKTGSYVLLQFVFPDTGKRSTKACNCTFTEDGIIDACKKSHLVKDALDRIDNVVEFWEWYNETILGKKEMSNNLITYREIFEKIEKKYFNGRNKNTKRKRSRDIPNDMATFQGYYGKVFKRFSNWDKYPEWEEIEKVLFTWEQGSKMFKDGYSVLKSVINFVPSNDKLLEKLSEIDPKQTDFKDKQSISLDEFLNWYNEAYNQIETLNRKQWKESRQNWLWVCSMCVVYGLRPTEIAAATNLFNPVTIKGYTFKAISDNSNKELLLVLGEKTYFGTTIKTGSRVCTPMVKSKQMIETLKIHNVSLPSYKPKKGSKDESICTGFNRNMRQRIEKWKCPITQGYAFRHLANQLGEREGIPQEIRSRSLGHSVQVNEGTYKKRSNIRTTVDLLTNHKKQPLSLDLALDTLKSKGFDIEDNSVKAMLKIIYQLEI